MVPVIHDAVTLRHFAAVQRMDILEACHSHRPEPRWTEAVRSEIESAERSGESHCSDILQETWLGVPAEPSVAELADVYRLQVGLNDGRRPPKGDRGEAEAIYFAEKHSGQSATDDNGAYEFANRRPSLGPGRVIDSIHILRTAVAHGDLTATDAHSIANQVEDAGRSFRPAHRARGTDYFAL
jgi:predicted nucleic acid-binding protein